jgi:hypothetical protein
MKLRAFWISPCFLRRGAGSSVRILDVRCFPCATHCPLKHGVSVSISSCVPSAPGSRVHDALVPSYFELLIGGECWIC